LDPAHPSRVFVAGEHLFRSEDAGATWRSLAPAAGEMVSVLVDPLDPGTIWAGTLSHGFVLSHDDGTTWSRGSPGRLDAAVRLVAHPVNPQLCYAVVFSPVVYQEQYGPAPFRASLYRTADGGAPGRRSP